MTAGRGGHFCSVFVRREGIKGFFRENERTANWRFYRGKRGNNREEERRRELLNFEDFL